MSDDFSKVMRFVRNENGSIVIEMSEVRTFPFDENPERSKYFDKVEDPIWITIHFYREPSEDDLARLYDICLTYNLFWVPDIAEEIKKDKALEYYASDWRIKFRGEFKDAYSACYEIQREALDLDSGDEKWSVMTSDTPPKNWKDLEPRENHDE